MKKMKTTYLTILVTALIAQSASLAQSLPGQPEDRNARPAAQAELTSSMKDYLAALRKGSGDATEKLAAIHATGLAKTPENFGEVTRLLNANVSSEHKTILIRLLASFHSTDDAKSPRQDIQTRLRALADSDDKQLAAAALMSYSRLGFLPDTEALLEKQLKRGFISKNDAFGEMAHVVHLASGSDQLRLIEKIGSSRNAYAIDIMASSIQSDEVRRSMLPESKRAMQALLEQNQPKFSVPIGEFSLQEAIVYADWLHALASLTAENTRTGYDDVILNHLDNVTTNPKKAISYFLSPAGKVTAQRLGKARLSNILNGIASYSDRLPFPQNNAVKDFAESIINFTNTMLR